MVTCLTAIGGCDLPVDMQRRELARRSKELEGFVTAMTEGMGRTQRREALGHYITGLLLEGERKSIAPIAERIAEASGELRQCGSGCSRLVTLCAWFHDQPFVRVFSRTSVGAVR